jgi:hypothetical protein
MPIPLKYFLANPKFRIVGRNNKFVPQEFLGVWKFGICADIGKDSYHSGYLAIKFEHQNIAEAELVIENRKKQLRQKHYVVKNYYAV